VTRLSAFLLAVVALVAWGDDPPPPAPLADGPITLVCLGDSLTEGDGDDGNGGFPARLGRWVAERRPKSQVTNLGRSGWASWQVVKNDDGSPSQLELAEAAISKAEGPCVACVWIGSNDLWFFYEYDGDATDETEAANLEAYTKHVTTILTRLRAKKATVLLALLDDQSKRPVALAGEAFTAITKDELARMSKQVARYNARLRELATAHGALTVDFSGGTWLTDRKGLADDGNHPNARGYDAIAGQWLAALEPLLAPRR